MKKRIDSIQALRFLACLCIFTHHCYITEYVYWGVSVFIVLSGFLMYLNYAQRAALSLSPGACLRFSVKKLRRLYALHVLAMLPILALEIYTKQEPAHILCESAASLLLVQAWSPEYAFSLNGVAWYLSVALFLYFAFPYILHLVKRLRRRTGAYAALGAVFAAQLAIGLAAAPLCRLVYGGIDGGFMRWFGYVFPPVRCLDFAAGCILGRIFVSRHEEKRVSRAAVGARELGCAVLIAAAIFLFRRCSAVEALGAIAPAALFLPFACALVYLFADGKGVFPRMLTNRVTVFLGNISAAFFLIHQDVIRLCYMALDRLGLTLEQCRPILFFGSGALALALSWGYERLYSRLSTASRGKMA